MHYVILSYHREVETTALSPPTENAMMAGLAAVRGKLHADGKLGPVGRLMPTTAATTLRFDGESLVVDGPFAETKEQLLGFYMVDCATLEDAIEAARQLAAPRIAAGLPGALEIRPLHTFHPRGA